MIDRQGGQLVFECDSCTEVLETGTDEWIEAYEQFRFAGWKSEKIVSQWVHRCPKCKGANE